MSNQQKEGNSTNNFGNQISGTNTAIEATLSAQPVVEIAANPTLGLLLQPDMIAA
jgi:hypothetical protein